MPTAIKTRAPVQSLLATLLVNLFLTTESSYSEIGGCDNVRITANGDAITVPGGWVNMGSDSIDTTAAAVNDITVIKKADRVEYIVKVS